MSVTPLANNSVIRDHFREASIVQKRLVMISFLVVLLAIILVFRLVYLQVDQYEKFATLSDKNRVDTHSIAPVRGLIFDRNGEPLASNIRAYNLEVLPKQVNDMNSLLMSINEVISLSEKDIEQFKKQVKYRPSFERQVLRANLSESEAAKYSVHQHRLPGTYLVAALQRYYPEGELMGHVLGYVGRINRKDLERVDKKAYGGTHYIGKLGIEAEYEDLLLGLVGSEDIETNAHGQQVRALTKTLPKTGKSLYLSLDTELQRKALDSLEGYEGAVVALDPKSGEVLAFVSAPGYDTNPFVNGISTKNYNLLRESDRRPLINRALNGRYAPGSTIKGFMGLIAMKNGISPSEKVSCPGWYSLPNSKHRYRCWKHSGHGAVDLHDSIVQSCDVYFYRNAKRLGIDRLYAGMTE
ncbi:MAG: penicillin-binding protein 2, partial [Arenicellales bacterium]